MLVLTRKVDERICIGDDVIVRIVEINKGNVRVGIEAPRNVFIYRHEVYERIQKENLQSAQGIAVDIAKTAEYWRDLEGDRK